MTGTRRRPLLIAAMFLVALAVQAQEKPAPVPTIELAPDSVKFAVLGDTGTGDRPQFEVGERMTALRSAFPFEFVLMLGDNLYGGESARDFRNKFERPYEKLLAAGVKFYASLGNHDEPERQTTYKQFNMGGERYYTFKPKDGVRFFALDSNYMDKKQIDWFENELKNSGSEWKIAFFHHPLYSSGNKHGPDVELRDALEPLMLKYGVDVVFAGHEHFYERIKPQKGIYHFILGSSAKLRRNGLRNIGITEKGFDTDNAFMVVEIAGNDMVFQTLSRAGAVIDSGKIRRVEEPLP